MAENSIDFDTSTSIWVSGLSEEQVAEELRRRHLPDSGRLSTMRLRLIKELRKVGRSVRSDSAGPSTLVYEEGPSVGLPPTPRTSITPPGTGMGIPPYGGPPRTLSPFPDESEETGDDEARRPVGSSALRGPGQREAIAATRIEGPPTRSRENPDERPVLSGGSTGNPRGKNTGEQSLNEAREMRELSERMLAVLRMLEENLPRRGA
ncbi:hypothetical protein KPH14_000922 [Odynerus spinipes]|uniref:Uncharacterized protein n=1 Tax=Odynerus spinipes TaxID=1348599 RepID=A0AAD9RG01_9HYME|nr:hypothetical protein KPH14_000922 [Odynerus spinipes]